MIIVIIILFTIIASSTSIFNKIPVIQILSKTSTNHTVYFREIQSDRIINGTQSYAQYAIYQKPTNSTSWNLYQFNHIVNAPQPGVNGPENEYRIYKLQKVILGNNSTNFPNAVSSVDLTSPGNWEKALQLNGTPLIGGMHGYEQYTGITFTKIINGNILTIIPSTLLSNRIKYTLILHNSCVTDLTGNLLALKDLNFTAI